MIKIARRKQLAQKKGTKKKNIMPNEKNKIKPTCNGPKITVKAEDAPVTFLMVFPQVPYFSTHKFSQN